MKTESLMTAKATYKRRVDGLAALRQSKEALVEKRAGLMAEPRREDHVARLAELDQQITALSQKIREEERGAVVCGPWLVELSDAANRFAVEEVAPKAKDLLARLERIAETNGWNPKLKVQVERLRFTALYPGTSVSLVDVEQHAADVLATFDTLESIEKSYPR